MTLVLGARQLGDLGFKKAENSRKRVTNMNVRFFVKKISGKERGICKIKKSEIKIKIWMSLFRDIDVGMVKFAKKIKSEIRIKM